MEQLVILVIIGLISLVNWLMQRSAELREKRKIEQAAQRGEAVPSARSQQEDQEQLGPQEDPAESMRKLMEALGLPMEEAPPPTLKQPPPSAPRMPEPPAIPPPAPSPRVEFRPTPQPRRPSSAAAVVAHAKPTRFRELLSSRGGIRDAIVLAEVLGKPRGLQ